MDAGDLEQAAHPGVGVDRPARSDRARVGMLLCQLSVIWLVAVALAAHVAAGWNPVTVLCPVLALHAQGTSVDLKAGVVGWSAAHRGFRGHPRR